jgi:hypothetical protein
MAPLGLEPSASRLAEVIRSRLGEATSALSAFWLPMQGDRDRYADDLRRELADQPAGVLVVRELGFENPNAVLFDLMRVVDRGRSLVESAFIIAPNGPWAIVLLARAPLSVSQASSPAMLPDWFPSKGGESVTAVVEDLSLSADAPLNCPEIRLPLLCERLFALESALLHRLRDVAVANPSAGQHLSDLVRRDGDSDDYVDLLEAFLTGHKSVTAPEAFRPSLRAGGSLVARLWELGHQRNPEEAKPSKALAQALALDGTIAVLPRDSFSSVLRRPSSPPANDAAAFARNLFGTLSSCCQLVTAVAHADSYGRYPVGLLASYSYDLRRAMSDMEGLLLALPPGD